jgi:hypothetical protein
MSRRRIDLPGLPFSDTVPECGSTSCVLFDAIKSLTWRHGLVKPERVRHEIDAAGTHMIALTLHANEVEYTPPEYRKPTTWGATMPDIKK